METFQRKFISSWKFIHICISMSIVRKGQSFNKVFLGKKVENVQFTFDLNDDEINVWQVVVNDYWLCALWSHTREPHLHNFLSRVKAGEGKFAVCKKQCNKEFFAQTFHQDFYFWRRKVFNFDLVYAIAMPNSTNSTKTSAVLLKLSKLPTTTNTTKSN